MAWMLQPSRLVRLPRPARRVLVFLVVIGLAGLGSGGTFAAARSAAPSSPTPAPAAAKAGAAHAHPARHPGHAKAYRPPNPHAFTQTTVVVPRGSRVAGTHRHHSHRGGTVAGVVVAPSGQPAAGASVRLVRGRHSHAKGILTDAGGNFSMRAVRPHRYRVVAAKKGTGDGSARTIVRSGGVSRVSIRLHGHSKHKHHRRKR